MTCKPNCNLSDSSAPVLRRFVVIITGRRLHTIYTAIIRRVRYVITARGSRWQHCLCRISANLLRRIRRGVRLFVCLPQSVIISVKTMQARIARSSLRAAPKTRYSFCNKIRAAASLVRRFPSNEGIKEVVILPLSIRLVKTVADRQGLVLIITNTVADELSEGTNVDDFERP